MTHQTEPVVLDDDWTDDDPIETPVETTALPPRPRRPKLPPVAIGLLGVVIAGAGFIGGVQVQKRSGNDAAATDGGMPAGLRAMMGGAGGPGAAGGSPGAAGGAAAGPGATGSGAGATAAASLPTTGQVANVKGSKLYVTTADGATVEVSVGSKATVQRLAESTPGAIHPGDSVIVTGTTGSNGTVRASAVQATASGVSLLGGLAGRGVGTGSARASGSSRSSGDSGDDAVDQLFQAGE